MDRLLLYRYYLSIFVATEIPLPFDQDKLWAYRGDSPELVRIKACKGMINVLMKWKHLQVDAEGNMYDTNHKEHLKNAMNAVAILIAEREITPDQGMAILDRLK